MLLAALVLVCSMYVHATNVRQRYRLYRSAARRHTDAMHNTKQMQGKVDAMLLNKQQQRTLAAGVAHAEAGAGLASALKQLSLDRGRLELCLRLDDIRVSQRERLEVWGAQQAEVMKDRPLVPCNHPHLTEVPWWDSEEEGLEPDSPLAHSNLSSSSASAARRPWCQVLEGPGGLEVPEVLVQGLRSPREDLLPPALIVAAAEGTQGMLPFTAIQAVNK
jgi:hypothetical protein